MDKKSRRGVVPESKKPSPQGATVLKGGQVPSEILAGSRPSSPAEVLPAQGNQPEIQVVDTSAQSRRPAPTPPSPDSTPRTPDSPDYSGWNLLGLEMDTTDPLLQREIRSNPITGEVVLVPVGKAAEAGESPTPAPDSLMPEAGSQAPNTKSSQP